MKSAIELTKEFVHDIVWMRRRRELALLPTLMFAFIGGLVVLTIMSMIRITESLKEFFSA